MSTHKMPRVENAVVMPAGDKVLFTIARMVIAISLLTACSETSFEGQDKVKQPLKTGPSGENLLPATPGSGNELDADTNCTGLSESQCREKKIEEGAKTSYRVVDCTTKPTAECDNMVEQVKITDGKENSRIIVKGCVDDGSGSTCQKIDDKPNVELQSDEAQKDEGINIGADEKIVTSFKFNETTALDGVSYIEFDFSSGQFSFGSTDQQYGLVRFQFDYTKANGESGSISQNGFKAPPRPAIKGVSSGTAKIENWPAQCGATFTPVPQLQYGYSGDGSQNRSPMKKPTVQIHISGTILRIDFDDSLGDRPGAVTFKNLNLQLTPCPS